jgi:hypothetical protein
MSAITVEQAIERICEELKNDKGYRIGWEANIAMSFKDQFNFSGHNHDPKVVHEIANKAAAAFLDQLIGKDIGEVDGMVAVHKMQQQANPLT